MGGENIIVALRRICDLFEELSIITKNQLTLADSEEPDDIDVLAEKGDRSRAIKNEIDGLRRELTIPMQSYTLYTADTGNVEAERLGERIDGLIKVIAVDTGALEEKLKVRLGAIQSDIRKNTDVRKGVIGYNIIDLAPADDYYINKIT
jgi:hypothetical protein